MRTLRAIIAFATPSSTSLPPHRSFQLNNYIPDAYVHRSRYLPKLQNAFEHPRIDSRRNRGEGGLPAGPTRRPLGVSGVLGLTGRDRLEYDRTVSFLNVFGCCW